MIALFGDAGWYDPQLAPMLVGVLIVATIGTGVLFAVSVLACWRRRSVRYVLITAAVGALFARSLVGIGTVLGGVPMTVHHIVEHGLDFVIAATVLYAVYRTGPIANRERT